MRFSFFLCKYLILLLLLSCCAVQEEVSFVPEKEVPLVSILPNLEDTSKEGLVAVVLGYGYNEGQKKASLLHLLDTSYGFAEDGGKILPFVYPDDFMLYNYERISLFPDRLSESLLALRNNDDLNQIEGIIMLGSPNLTHYALAQIQDSGYTNPIFSVFSQDDVLGTEAGSTIVIDYALSEKEEEKQYDDLGEIDLTYPGNVFDILSPLVNASLDWENITKTGLFISALRAEYVQNTDCEFITYIDSQTKLQSQNHYVLQGEQ